jgi:hypothetical protein
MRRLFRTMLAAWIWLHRKGRTLGQRRAVPVKPIRLVDLDERTLKDIGLEPWSSALGAEIAMRRHQGRRRWDDAMSRLY